MSIKPMCRGEHGRWHELNRLDLRNRAELSAATLQRVLVSVSKVFHTTDGLIVLDQINEEGWGVIGPRVREHLTKLAQSDWGKLIFIDSRAHIGRFKCGVLKPNRAECLATAGGKETTGDPEDDVIRAAGRLSTKTGRPLFCTLGEEGILVVRPGQTPVTVPAIAVDGPIDIVGAGDSATAGRAAALCSGGGEIEAAGLGNLVASITIGQLGTTGTATPQEIVARWHKVNQSRDS